MRILPVAIGMLAAVSAVTTAHARPKWNVAIVVHDQVELLDFAGPGEVFQLASQRSGHPDDPWFHVYTVAPSEGPVLAQRFVTVLPEFTIEDCPDPDIIVVPGGNTTVLRGDPAFMTWVADNAGQGDTVLTVCTGAFVAAELGLLDGGQATTHHNSIERLRRDFPEIEVVESTKVVDNGSVLTSGGISSGIEGSLHLLARLLGGLHATGIASHMEYRWTPDREYEPLNPQLEPADALAVGMNQLRRNERYQEAIALAESSVDIMPIPVRYEWACSKLASGDATAAERGLREVVASGEAPRYASYNLACSLSRLGRGDEACEALLAELDRGRISPGLVLGDSDLESARSSPRFAEVREKLGLPSD